MKINLKNFFRLLILSSVFACQVWAQTLTTLYSFAGGNLLGAGLNHLILSNNVLYGTTASGGSSSNGTVFAINTDGTGFTSLYSFTVLYCCPFNNADGAYPNGLTLSGNTLYGTAILGGSGGGQGTVFAVNTDGTSFTTLYNFSAPDPSTGINSDGDRPGAGLILSGNTLYGTAGDGGSSDRGTVFAVNTDGTGFVTLYSFTASYTNSVGMYTNSDGSGPHGLVLSGNTLYGIAREGGISGNGTVFKVNTDGSGFATLHSFTLTFNGTNTDGVYGTNNDGVSSPYAALVLSGDVLYGTAILGGSWGNGTVFKINTDGTGFKVLHTFTVLSGYTNSDGVQPEAGLMLSGNTLYGTASAGGRWRNGTVFAVNTDGSGFTVLHSFTGSDGAFPESLIFSGNTLYGVTGEGGTFGSGTIFSISLPVTPPQLAIIPTGSNVILSWPTNATGFTLQSTTNLAASAVWTTVSPLPVIVSGQNTVINPISGAQQFYRLAQ